MDFKLKYKLLHNLTKLQIKQLLNIISKPNIMKWIGNGNIWTLQYLNNLIKFSKSDFESNYKNISYFYFAVLNNSTIIGLAGIHPGFGKYKQHLQVFYLLDEKCQGFGLSKFIRQRLKKCSKALFPDKYIYVITYKNNTKNIKSLKNNKKLDNFTFKNKIYYVYSL